MRSRVSRLPQPVLFSPKRHARKNAFQRVISDSDFGNMMLLALVLGVWLTGMSILG